MVDQFRARPRRRSTLAWPARLAALLAAMSLGAAPHGAAQTRPGLVSFQRIAIPDDVPAHLTTAAVQDQHGLLWFGTQDGLVRYDGYSYKVFRARPGDAGALGGSYVRSLYVARDGRIWAGTISGGVSVFDPRSERFSQYRSGTTGLAHDRVESIAEDRAGMMWLATDNGLDRLDPASGAITHFRHAAHDAASLASDLVRAVLADREGRLWVGGQDGLQLWRDGRWLRVASEPGGAASLAGQPITRLMQDAQGRIWIGTRNHGAAMLDPARLPAAPGAALPPARELLVRWLPSDQPDALTPGPSTLSHYWVYAMAQAANGEIWVATFGNGIDVIDPVSLAVVDRLRHDAGNIHSIGASRIGALLSDRAGAMWAGTWGGGIAQHHPATRAFLKIRHSAINPDTPGHPGIVRAMQGADGKLWLGTNGEGVDVLDAGGHVVARHRARRDDPGALADGSITCLLQDAQGGIWIATLDGTLHYLRAGARAFQRFGEAQGVPGGPIRAMVQGPDGAIWVGAQKGLGRIAHGGAGKAAVYRHAPDDERTLSGREVESLAFTADGTLWVGTENGVNAFDTARGTAVRIRHDPRRGDSLPDNWVPDLMVDRLGKLWLATQSGVAILSAWDGRQARFDIVSRRIGLPEQPAESLLEDAQGMVWLNGRTRIDPATWQFRSYGPADGADFRTRYIASRALANNGDLLFGSPEGLLIVRPGLLRAGGAPLRVVATALSVAGHDVAGAAELAQLELRAPQRSLRVEFAAQGASAPDQVRYRYRLEGYDGDWVEVGARQRVAAYTGLPPGDYMLRVQAAPPDAAWAADGTMASLAASAASAPMAGAAGAGAGAVAESPEWRLHVTVTPAFYQTIGFRALMWLLGAATVFALFRLRLRQLRRRAAHLERTVAERTAALESAYRDIEQASLTDPLTGLRNRRFLEQAFQADLDLVARRHADGNPPPGSDLLLFMLDLDHFKAVNDRYGHAAGDAVLVQAAAVLRQCMRSSDHVVRWGGEEFLLLARLVDRSQGPAMAEKIRAAIASHEFVLPDGTVLRKTVSIGYAACPAVPGQMGGMTLDSLQQLADTALYAAKRSWRDAWVGLSLDAVAQEGAVRRFLADPAANASEWRVEASRTEGMQWGQDTGNC